MRTLPLFPLLASLLVAFAAHAGDPVVAARLFSEGRSALERGDLETACTRLAESFKNDARVGTAGKLAECEEKRGHLAAARAHWQDAVDLARAQNDARRAAAEDQLVRLDRALPKLVLHASKLAPNETIKVDARVAGEASGPLPLDPGDHVVEASAAGFVSWSSHVHLAGDGSSVVTLEVPALVAMMPPNAPSEAAPHLAPEPSSSAPAVESTSTTAPSSSSPLHTIGMVATGVGVVALGVGGVFLGQAVSLNGQSNSGCVGSLCNATAGDQRRSAYDDGNVATGLLIGGGVVAAAGLAMWIFAPHTRATTGVRVVPVAGAKSAGLVMGGSF